MTDRPDQYFNELMKSWATAHVRAWQTQSKMFEQANSTMAEALKGGAEAGPSGGEAAAPFDMMWTGWADAFENWSKYLESVAPTGAEEEIGFELLCRFVDPSVWLNIGINELNQTIEHLAEGVQFADLWRAERRFLSASREWLELRRHSLRYRSVINRAWMRAFGRFCDALSAQAQYEGASAPDWQGLVGQWLDLANEELLSTQRSDEFLEAQRDLLRASINFRDCQRRFVEEFCEAQAIPTRTEIDDLHRTVTELRRELRSLKRARARSGAAEGAKSAKGQGGAARRGATARTKAVRSKPSTANKSSTKP